MGKEINQYPDTAVTVETGSWFDIDQDLGASVFQSQKLSLAVLRSAIGNIYVSDGQLTETRAVDLDDHSLQFFNGAVSFNLQEVHAIAASTPTLNIQMFTGNNYKIDLTNADEALTLSLLNAVPSTIFTFEIISNGTDNIVWPANVKWEAGQVLIVTPIATAIDMVTMFYNGTNFLASFGTNFQ